MNLRNLFVSLLFGAAATSVAVANPVSSGEDKTAGKQQASLQKIKHWPQDSQKAAKAMVEKYGKPDETTDSMWIWNDNGDWKRTIVYSEPVDHNFPMPHKDVLE